MKKFKRLALLLAGAVLSFQSYAATYTFSGFFGELLPPGETDYTVTFSLWLPDFVVANTLIPASAISSCTTHASPCASVTFHVDAAADGLVLDPGVQAIEFTSVSGLSGYYYFSAPAFATPGSYASLYGFNPATLVVSVPEPSTYYCLLLGIVITTAVARRSQARALPSGPGSA